MLKLTPSWQTAIGAEFEKQYMKDIKSFLAEQIQTGKIIYPHPKNIFHALDKTDFNDIKVVILGQDPYHGAGQAHGLSFSVQEGIKIPPSLRNIYKEIGISPESGDLSHWTQQGVLLLNAILTVEAGKPASHSKIGWGTLTDEIIKQISDKREGVVFLLWGAFAHQKKELIDSDKHLILTAPHPSPFSAHKGFFGCGHFTQVNEYLKNKGEQEIKW